MTQTNLGTDEDDLQDKIFNYLLENLEDIKYCDSGSDLSWIALRLANKIDGGNRTSV